MDNSEYGITDYVGDASLKEIPCIIKLLYSDFIVVEIGEDGKALEPKIYVEPQVAKTEKEETGEPELKRPKILSDTDLESIENVASGKSESHHISTENVEKDDRREAHEYIRKRYKNSLETNGELNGIVIKKHTAQSSKNDRRRQDQWPKTRGDYLHFVLTKENHDHFYSLSLIARFSRLNVKMFSVAGNKDRRAITSQLVCAYRVPKQKILSVAPMLRGIWINNLEYSDKKIQLGCLKGNRFSIVLRDIGEIADDELKSRIIEWENLGFLNYFGHQRFGSIGVSTAEIGRLILSLKWKEAVEMILSPKNAKGPMADCLKKYRKTGNADLALQNLRGGQSFTQIEAIVLGALKKNKYDYRAAIMSIFRDSRSLYVHAYQSLVFNKILSRRVKKYGLKVLEGDVKQNGDKVTIADEVKIHEVTLPLPSTNTILPDNEVGLWYKEIMEADGLTSESFETLERDFAVGDVARLMLLKPDNVTWEVLSYIDPRAVLQSSPFKSESATAKNSNVSEEEPIKNEAEQGDVEIATKEQETSEEVKMEPKEVTSNEAAKTYRALKIQFDLPSSCYATVALRELLRTDFGKAAQKQKMGVEN